MYPKDFFEQQKISVKNGQCFVLMPFAPNFTEVYEVIKSAIEGPELGFSCDRADQLFGGGHIITDILRCLAASEIVIADLTSKNANVFYELGIAHTVKEMQKVLILSQHINDVPFDLRPFRCIIYEQSKAGLSVLSKRLVTEVREVAKAAFRFSVDHDGSYKFPQRLSGADHCFYDFEIPLIWVGADAVKFKLRVDRHALDRAAEPVHDDSYFLSCEASLPLPGLPWSLVVESIDPQSRATFRVVTSETRIGEEPAGSSPLLEAASELTTRLIDLSGIYRGTSTLPFTKDSLHGDFCEIYSLRRDPIVSFDDRDPNLLRSDEHAVQRLRMRMAYELTFAVTALYVTAKYLGLAERARRDLREKKKRSGLLEPLSRVRSSLQGDAGIFEEQQDAIAELMWAPSGTIISSAEFRDKLLKRPGWEPFTMLLRFFVHFDYKLDHEVKKTIESLEHLTTKLGA